MLHINGGARIQYVHTLHSQPNKFNQILSFETLNHEKCDIRAEKKY